MSAAALTPRVRTLAVCDEAVRSEIEEGVFTLEGVRQGFRSASFPCRRTLNVYLVLSHPRKAKFEGVIRVIDEDVDKFLRLAKFVAEFDQDNQSLPLAVDLGEVVFPSPKVYTIKVEFPTFTGPDVLKSETYFSVLEEQE